MSRIGNRVLELNETTDVEVNSTDRSHTVIVKGKLGEISKTFDRFVDIKVENKTVVVSRKAENKQAKSYHGTVNSIINGMIVGVNEGYKVELLIKGVGYKAALEGNKLVLKVGFSHQVDIMVPEGIKLVLPKPTEITITGIDKQFVTQFASKIYLVKKPEPYGGKGIMYKGQIIRRKAGKSAGGK
jgi:large subunit ribosomal protein L6